MIPENNFYSQQKINITTSNYSMQPIAKEDKKTQPASDSLLA
ncbi:hypothetical protein CPter91_2968 [Collimonas pratensis]|uniref:Uncharacterized protein n=1 Tax=Collimonas pratensis TaxID=279113 RepID=A0A127Q5K3_9BURK|nr:hypothetical protein CPter91_2968 [Collimonas pratensis]